MQCPSCETELVHTHQEDKGLLGAERCPTCGGFWVTAEERHGFEPEAWESIESMGLIEKEALSRIICPTCITSCTGVSLADHAEIQIDRCPNCHGLWLDRGELESVYQAVLEFGEATGTLEHKPQSWSAMHWLIYRLGQDWWRSHRYESTD